MLPAEMPGRRWVAATLRRMSTLRTLFVLVSAVALTFVLALVPASATEAGVDGDDGGGKITLPEEPRDQLGLIILGLTGLATLAGLANAAKQLKGDREAASGQFRWR